MSALRRGRRAAVLWQRGEPWHVRVLVAECPAADYASILEAVPPAGAAAARTLWYCLTPDLDVYPHVLAVPPLQGL
eukprot:6764902-Lingulodinium_polyedra.AAC.1